MRKSDHHVYIIGRPIEFECAENENYFSVTEYTYLHLAKLLQPISFEVVVDFAYTSVPGTSFSDPVKDFSENLLLVIRHLELCHAIRPCKYIYVSSGGTVYVDVAQKPISEQAANFPLSPYGVTKMACERYVHMYYKSHGVPAIIVRPSNIYGPGQQPFKGQGLVATALGLAYQGRAIQVYGDGSHVRDYLYIDDFCDALNEVAAKGSPGAIYNIGTGKGVSIKEVLKIINSTVSKDGYVLTCNNLPERPFDVHMNVLDSSLLAGLSGWKPATTLALGIDKTWQWIKNYMHDQECRW